MNRRLSASLAGLMLGGFVLCAPRAAGQAEPPAEPPAETPHASDATAAWRFRPALFVLGVFEHERGLVALADAPPADAPRELQPALALGLEAARTGARGGFQGELSVLGRAPFDPDARAILFDGRAHAFRMLGSGWRLDLDEALRLERREAVPRGDFQRHQALVTLERSATQGPAWRLQLSDRRLGLPRARALDVTQNTLAFGAVSSLRPGTSLEAKALLRRFGQDAQLRTHAGAAFEATRVHARGLVALRYQVTAALGQRRLAEALATPLPSRVGAFADFPAQATPEPPAAGAATGSPEELPDVPLADALDDDGESWPARQEHLVSLYASRLLGSRLRLVLRGQARWLRDREPLSPELLSFDERRWHVRATLRWRLSRRSALIAQAAHASESGNLELGALTRSQVFFGLQLR